MNQEDSSILITFVLVETQYTVHVILNENVCKKPSLLESAHFSEALFHEYDIKQTILQLKKIANILFC